MGRFTPQSTLEIPKSQVQDQETTEDFDLWVELVETRRGLVQCALDLPSEVWWGGSTAKCLSPARECA
jgi:hypothetical protein